MATLPMVCLSARSVTWPTPEDAVRSFPGAAKNRKGLRHSPGVLMDVMRTPTSVKSASTAWSWSVGDQTASFSGGRPQHWFSPPQNVHPMNNYIVTRAENKRRKPYSKFNEHPRPQDTPRTLNFAPANAIPWHTSVHNMPTRRPSTVWHYVPYSMEPEPTPPIPTSTTPSPEAQQSEVVYRYAPSGTEAPASFTQSGTPRKTRHHVRLFTNAHQYKRDMESSSTIAAPSSTILPQTEDIVVDTTGIDEEHKKSRWFKQLLGQVIAAAEMTNH